MAQVKIEAFIEEGVWMLVDTHNIGTIPSSHTLDLYKFTKKKAQVLATDVVYCLMDLARV